MDRVFWGDDENVHCVHHVLNQSSTIQAMLFFQLCIFFRDSDMIFDTFFRVIFFLHTVFFSLWKVFNLPKDLPCCWFWWCCFWWRFFISFFKLEARIPCRSRGATGWIEEELHVGNMRVQKCQKRSRDCCVSWEKGTMFSKDSAWRCLKIHIWIIEVAWKRLLHTSHVKIPTQGTS